MIRHSSWKERVEIRQGMGQEMIWVVLLLEVPSAKFQFILVSPLVRWLDFQSQKLDYTPHLELRKPSFSCLSHSDKLLLVLAICPLDHALSSKFAFVQTSLASGPFDPPLPLPTPSQEQRPAEARRAIVATG